MDEHNGEPTRIFRELKDRPTPELDSGAAWRRLRRQLPERGQRRAPAWAAAGRLSWALAAMLVLAVALFVFWPAALDDSTGPVAAGSDLVLLADGSPEAGAAPAPSAADPGAEIETDAGPAPQFVDGALELEIRLVQGYAGAPPAGARPEGLMGAGGASELADVRATLQAVLPFPELAMLGSWSGEVVAGTGLAQLTDTYGLEFSLVPADGSEAGDGQPLLRDVRLVGGGQPLVAQELALEPGRLYLFGVREQGSEPGSLVLAIRLRHPAPPIDSSMPPRPDSESPRPQR